MRSKRVVVSFFALFFLVACGKPSKLTSPVERHKTFPYGLGQGVFFEDGESKTTPMLIMIEKGDTLEARLFDWSNGKVIQHDFTAQHEFHYSSDELDCRYKIEGIMGSIVMTRECRRLNHQTGEWESFREVHGLMGHTVEEFKAEVKRRQPAPENT